MSSPCCRSPPLCARRDDDRSLGEGCVIDLRTCSRETIRSGRTRITSGLSGRNLRVAGVERSEPPEPNIWGLAACRRTRGFAVSSVSRVSPRLGRTGKWVPSAAPKGPKKVAQGKATRVPRALPPPWVLIQDPSEALKGRHNGQHILFSPFQGFGQHDSATTQRPDCSQWFYFDCPSSVRCTAFRRNMTLLARLTPPEFRLKPVQRTTCTETGTVELPTMLRYTLVRDR